MTLLLTPFLPYILWAEAASWAILQNIEGAAQGIVWEGVNINTHPWQGMVMVVVLAIMVITFCGIVWSSWRLSRKRVFPIIAILLLSPAVISAFSPTSFEFMRSVPTHFQIGNSPSGVSMGTVAGSIASIALFVLFGVAIFSNLMSWFGILSGWKKFIDCFWYPTGILVAAAFLVLVDQHQRTINARVEVNRASTLAIHYLDRQTATVRHQLQMESATINGIDLNSLMQVIERTRYHINELVQDDVSFVGGLGFKAMFGNSAPEDRKLLETFNDLQCLQLPEACSKIPIKLWVALRNSKVWSADLDKYVAFIPHVIFDYIGIRTKKEAELFDKLRSTSPAKNIQWLFLLLLSIFAGGKVCVSILPVSLKAHVNAGHKSS